MQTSQQINVTTKRQIVNIQNTLRTLEIEAHQAGIGYDFLLMAAKRQFIIAALDRRKWNQCRAARDLKMHRNTLTRTMAELKISKPNRGKQPRSLRQPAFSLNSQQVIGVA